MQFRGECIIEDWISRTDTIAKSKKYYAHFDYRTNIGKVKDKVTNTTWVAHHGFYPFIHYEKECSKYSTKGLIPKKRDICYAAHIDRCIFQYYSHKLNEQYNLRIRELDLEDVAVAYRSDLKLNNIHLAKKAFDYIKNKRHCYVLIGDFTSFFDNLDHAYLKKQWSELLGVNILPPDHYNIYKNITKYSKWERDDLLQLNGLPKNAFGRKKLNELPTVLTTEQFRKYRSHIHKNTAAYGIPQGSPISGLLANVYMMDVDREINQLVKQYEGKYMRYSDDFIVIIPVDEIDARPIINTINQIISNTPGLELQPQKTQIYKADLPIITNVGDLFLDRADTTKKSINFLGFTFDGNKITLRPKTVSKYYYRMYRKAHTVARDPEQKGKKYLYERYSEKGARTGDRKKGNFFTYVFRAEKIFGKSEKIRQPVKNNMAKIRKVLKKGK